MQTTEMPRAPFQINNRFIVNPTTGVVIDKTEKRETRLEPRIMEVLCLLIAHSGTTVSREEIVTSIWKDYGGGDDGLTQAISSLRKSLEDHQKELIQTIPKKGYCFRGEISKEKPLLSPKLKMDKKWGIGVLVILVCLPALLPFWNEKEKVTPQHLPYTPVAYPGNSWESDSLNQNAQNTIVTLGPDSTRYKLVMIDDQPPRFYINDSSVPTHLWEPHQPLINQLKKQLQGKKR